MRGKAAAQATILTAVTPYAQVPQCPVSVTLMEELLELASGLNQRTIYDAHYLALAETLDCEQWTTDKKSFRAASQLPKTSVGWASSLSRGSE